MKPHYLKSIAAVGLALVAAGTVNAATLARHYEFEDSGNFGLDSTGAPDATVTGTLMSTTGPTGFGNAADFSGGSGYLYQTPANAAPESRMA